MNDIVVIGDLIMDEYVKGTTTRVSPEAPIPVVLQNETFRVRGGASNVAQIIEKNTDVNVHLIGACDESDEEFFGTNVLNCFPSHTNIKTRIISGDQQIVRVDKEQKHLVDYHDILECLETIGLDRIGLVVLSDYDKGVLRRGDTAKLVERCRQKNIDVFVDAKDTFAKYFGATLIKCNESEFENFFEPVGSYYIQTLGSKGCRFYAEDNRDVSRLFSVDSVEVNDVTGAGDTFLAFLVAYFSETQDLEYSINQANKGARLSVQHLGNYVPSRKEIEETLVFTNGVFDILHIGHIQLLNYASTLGDRLIVGLNSDDSVKRLKGENRPINDQNYRREMLESLGHEVVIFDEDTPYKLMKKLKPDIIVKGGDYSKDQVVGSDIAQVEIFETVRDYSTSNMIQKIKQ